MPKPKGKAGPSKGHNKNSKRRSAPKSEYDYIPESAIDREPNVEESEDDDSTSSRIKIDIPVAMWVSETTLHGGPRFTERLGFWALRSKTLLGEETFSSWANKGTSNWEPIPWDRPVVRPFLPTPAAPR
jgi:hypothetical protein